MFCFSFYVIQPLIWIPNVCKYRNVDESTEIPKLEKRNSVVLIEIDINVFSFFLRKVMN